MSESLPVQGSRLSFVSLRPLGIGLPREHHFGAALGAAWTSRRAFRFGLNVLRYGVCGDCSFGTLGWRDEAIEGVHMCTRRLENLKRWTSEAFDPAQLPSVAELRTRTEAQLEELGRIPSPMIWRSSEEGFRRLGWEDALKLAASRIGAAGGRVGFLLSPAQSTNEGFFVLQRLARALETPHIDLLRDAGHRLVLSELQRTTGLGAGTCSLKHCSGADLVLLWGTGLRRHPFLARLLYLARKAGTRVVAIGPVRDPEFDGVWLPSDAGSALFGSRVVDEYVPVRAGGDRHLAWGLLAALAESGGFDEDFVAERLETLGRLRDDLESVDWAEVEEATGLSEGRVRELAATLQSARTGLLCTGPSLARSPRDSDTPRAVLSLALLRGWIGREGSGVLPLGAEAGTRAALDLGVVGLCGDGEGWTAQEQLAAAGRGDLEALYVVGAGLLDCPRPKLDSAGSLARVGFRVHQSTHLDPSMLLDSGEAVLVLPTQSRFEQCGGSTFTSVDRRVRFSPEIRGHSVGEARPDWEIPLLIGRRLDGAPAEDFEASDGGAVRERIAGAIDSYAPIDRLHAPGESFQWGGPTLHVERFATESGRARLQAVEPPPSAPSGLRLSTRRTGLAPEEVLLSPDDAAERSLVEGGKVWLVTSSGRLGAVVRLAAVASGSIQAHWPRARALVGSDSCTAPVVVIEPR